MKTIADGSLVVLEACHGHLDVVVVRRAWVHLAVHGVVAVVGQALVCPPSLAITPPNHLEPVGTALRDRFCRLKVSGVPPPFLVHKFLEF